MASSVTHQQAPSLRRGVWELDPARSLVGFEVPHFWGLITVKGRFGRFRGRLDFSAEPPLELTVEASSLDTGNARRDTHLRSADFFAADQHPRTRFTAETVEISDQRLRASGRLDAAGTSISLEVEGRVRPVGDEFEVEATAVAPHRKLGMTWSPLGMLRPRSRLLVRGRLINDAIAGNAEQTRSGRRQ